LRAWVHRLRAFGVHFHLGHRWLGFAVDGSLRLQNSSGEFNIKPDAVILSAGGASWPQLGSTGIWVPWLQERGVEIASWQSANCGFDVEWSAHLREKFDGAPLKAVSLTFTGLDGVTESRRGELLVKEYGIEGGLIYSFSKRLREYINARGEATFFIDLLPDRNLARVTKELSRPRGSRTISRTCRTAWEIMR
jgi:predicted flavoprotein YhiN